jgi:hypothetical protein
MSTKTHDDVVFPNPILEHFIVILVFFYRKKTKKTPERGSMRHFFNREFHL